MTYSNKSEEKRTATKWDQDALRLLPLPPFAFFFCRRRRRRRVVVYCLVGLMVAAVSADQKERREEERETGETPVEWQRCAMFK